MQTGANTHFFFYGSRIAVHEFDAQSPARLRLIHFRSFPDSLLVAMTSTSRSSSSRRVTMVSLGGGLYLMSVLSLLLFGCTIITPAVSSPTADPPADHESILHALRFQGLTASADALDRIIWNNGFLVPASATLFVPMNAAMAPVAASLNVTELIDLLSHHIVTENLPMARFVQLPAGTKLETMVENSSLAVTENTETMMTINHQEVMPQDLCTISTVACYVVKEVLMPESGTGKMKSFGASAFASGEAPIQPPTVLPLPPMGAPMMPPMGAPSPLGAPVPAGSPTMLPPPESPVSVPVPADAPAITILPPPGSPSTIFPSPGSPGEAPLSPGEDPEEASSAAAATTASMATLVAAVMLTILVL